MRHGVFNGTIIAESVALSEQELSALPEAVRKELLANGGTIVQVTCNGGADAGGVGHVMGAIAMAYVKQCREAAAPGTDLEHLESECMKLVLKGLENSLHHGRPVRNDAGRFN